jgi:DNA-binding beta-propeller fold protein YncE
MRSLLGKLTLPTLLVCLAPCAATAASAQTILATLPVPGFPGQGDVDPIAQKAYIPTGAGSNAVTQVTVIDEKTNTISNVITVPSDWQAVTATLNAANGLLYIGAESGGLYIVNPKTDAVVGFINVPAASVAINPITNTIYVSDFTSDLYVIDGATDNIVTSLVINGIQNIAVNPVTNRIYAAVEDFSPGYVAVVDGNTNQQIAMVAAGSGLTFGVAVDPVRNLFYSFEQFGTVTVYDGRTNTQITAIPIPGQPSGLAVDPITRTIYVSDSADNTVDVVNGNTNQITGSFAVGSGPEYLTDDPFHKLLYVGNGSGTQVNGVLMFSVSVARTN